MKRVAQELAPCKFLQLSHPAGSSTTSRPTSITVAVIGQVEFLKQLVDLGCLEINTHLEVWVQALEVDLGQVTLIQDRGQNLGLD